MPSDPIADAIAAALPLFFRPGDTFEVRFLNVGEPGRVHAGWLTVADLPAAARSIARLAARAEGTYFTPNPVRRPAWAADVPPDAFPMVSAGRGKPAATDADVSERRWLIVDIDPVRPSGVCATDDEKAAAWTVAENVRAGLAAAGRRPVAVADSGNGFHLYYRLTPPLPGGTAPGDDPLARTLKMLAHRFDTAAAQVDATVFNASRIMKVPGTWAKKGANTPARPHRPSRILEAAPDAGL